MFLRLIILVKEPVCEVQRYGNWRESLLRIWEFRYNNHDSRWRQYVFVTYFYLMQQDSGSGRTYYLLLVIVCIALFGNTIQNDYVMDDGMVLRDNVFVKKGVAGIVDIFSTPRSGGTELNSINEFYRPLSLAMFALEVELFGMKPAVGHVMNILVFIGCVLVLYKFTARLGANNAIAFLTAFLFAIHPVHTEVVANIKSRDELLCFFMGFLALNLFAVYQENGKWKYLIGGGLALFFAFLAKETVVTFIAMVPLLSFLYYSGHKRRAVIVTSITVCITLIYLLLRQRVLGASEMDASEISFMENSLVAAPDRASGMATKIAVLGRYLKLLFIPFPLLCNYSYSSIPFSDWTNANAWISLSIYATLIALYIYALAKKKWRLIAFGVFFYLINLVLFSNILFLIGAQMAERFLFFASAGFCLAFAVMLGRWMKIDRTETLEWRSAKTSGLLLVLLCLYGGATIARNFDWKDNMTLYRADLKKSPNDARLYYWLAAEIAQTQYSTEQDTTKRKELDRESIVLLHHALTIYPDYADAMAELGWLYQRNNKYDSAYFFNSYALRLEGNNIEANNNMGNFYYAQGQYNRALPYLKQAVAGNPSFKKAYISLANCYLQMKLYDEAISSAGKALELDPEFADAHQVLGNAYMNIHNLSAAEEHFNSVLRSRPAYVQAKNNLGVIYLNTQRYREAIIQFEYVVSNEPEYAHAYSNLSRAYFFTGRYNDAITIINKQIISDSNNTVDIPILALCYYKTGKMDLAKKYEAIARQRYADFKLE